MPSRKEDRRSRELHVADDRRDGGKDRRRSQRILVDLEVDYQCEDTFLFAYITDMSEMGIFIRTNNPESPGTNLNLRFTLPGGEKPLELEGEVIWINPFRPGSFQNTHPGMGVRLSGLSSDEKRELLALIRKIAYLEGSAEEDEMSCAEYRKDAADQSAKDTDDEEESSESSPKNVGDLTKN